MGSCHNDVREKLATHSETDAAAAAHCEAALGKPVDYEYIPQNLIKFFCTRETMNYTSNSKISSSFECLPTSQSTPRPTLPSQHTVDDL
jgi:hypothetical protein